jgi:hypothetical protein
MGAVERVVLALNSVNKDHQGAAYETSEREAPCRYIDESLSEAGVDVTSLAARSGLSRYEITDQWRRWHDSAAQNGHANYHANYHVVGMTGRAEELQCLTPS